MLPRLSAYSTEGWLRNFHFSKLLSYENAHDFHPTALQLDFIQCPFPNQIQFGLEKLHPKIAYNFPNQFQFGLERKKLILQDAYSKANSDWLGKFWWPLSTSWKFQTKFSLVWKNHWLMPTPWYGLEKSGHGYDHNSIWPAGIVPLIPIPTTL